MFVGFKHLSANFTPTPNQFFDHVVGHYPGRVVTVVAILIRSTLGWEDPVTGERRVEAELPLAAFVRPELCRNSARQGLEEACAAGFIVKTADHSNRDGARYALRWEDDMAQRQAIERARRATEDPILTTPDRAAQVKILATGGPEIGRPEIGGPKSGRPKIGPPYKSKESKKDSFRKENSESEKQTLNVGEGLFNFVSSSVSTEPEWREREVQAIVAELRDWGSERRHRQLVSLCHEHGAGDLPLLALQSTRQRLTQESQRGPVGSAPAYYHRTLLAMMANKEIFVPTADEKADLRGEMGLPAGATQAQVQAALRASLLGGDDPAAGMNE